MVSPTTTSQLISVKYTGNWRLTTEFRRVGWLKRQAVLVAEIEVENTAWEGDADYGQAPYTPEQPVKTYWRKASPEEQGLLQKIDPVTDSFSNLKLSATLGSYR